LKQLSLAVANYHDANGNYPPAYILGPEGRPWHSWRVLILPYIEQNELYKEYDFCEPWDGPNNQKLADRMPRTYALHGEGKPGNTITNYLAVVGPETVWPGSITQSNAEIKDASGQTILLVENLGAGIHWMEPRDLSFSEMDFRINSPSGINSKYEDPAIVMVDGSLRRLKKNLTPETLRALLTIQGGEAIEEDESRGFLFLPDGRLRPIREP
jgi:hypothetical protein